MSFKFERDVVRDSTRPDAGALLSKALETAQDAAAAARSDSPAKHASDVVKHVDELADSVGDFVESVGESLTGGKTPTGFLGPKGYLMAYIRELENNPLRTKMVTAGILAGAQEYLASWLAEDINEKGSYMTSRVPKMIAYGSLVSAPLGHLLIWCLQRAFRGRTSVRAKVTQILVSNLVMAPIQNAVYLIAMAIIAGANKGSQIRATLRIGFWKVMKVSWLTSPLALAFAQKFLPDHLWVPFFNIVAFTIGTYINTITKKKRLIALRKRFVKGQQRGNERELDREREREQRDRDREQRDRDREQRDRDRDQRDRLDRDPRGDPRDQRDPRGDPRDRMDRDRRPGPPPPSAGGREAPPSAPGNPEYAPSHHMGGPAPQY
jgi:hypothetical protein